MMIRRFRVSQDAKVIRASSLYGHSLQPNATMKFLASDTHHIFVAYEGNEPAGFTTGVETTHPDKGTKMFRYELEVTEAFRKR